jgi:hypothetical protein
MKRFQFSIRDLLLVTVIIALAVGWWLDRDSIRQQREALQQEHGKLQQLTSDVERRGRAVVGISVQQTMAGMQRWRQKVLENADLQKSPQ